MSIKSDSSTTPVLPSDPSFHSLAALKTAHRELMAMIDASEERGMPDAGFILGRYSEQASLRPETAESPELSTAVQSFLARAAASGRALSRPKERAEAQRLLNYWTSSVSVDARLATNSFRPAVLEPYADKNEKEIAQTAAKIVSAYSPVDKALTKRLVLRLVHLADDNLVFDLVKRSAAVLTESAQPERSREILTQLAQCGLIVVSADGCSLVGSALLGYWQEARGWLAQRKELRGAASFWQSHERSRSALLEGTDLRKEAEGYLDLNRLERDFIEHSRDYDDRREQSRRTALTGWVVALALFSIILAVCCTWALRERSKAMKAARRAKFEKTQATEANDAFYAQNVERTWDNIKLSEDLADRYRASYASLLSSLRRLAQDPVLSPAAQASVADLIRSSSFPSSGKNVPQMDTADAVEPGSRMLVWSGGTEKLGTLGVFLRDATGRLSLVGPASLLSGPKPSEIYAFSGTDTSPDAGTLLAVNPAQGGSLSPSAEKLVAVNLQPDQKVRNILPFVGALKSVLSIDQVKPGLAVVLVGRRSGPRQGTVIRYDSDARRIVTTCLSTNGDEGAPVTTPQGEILGILSGADDDTQSTVLPLDPFLKRAGLNVLDVAPSAQSALAGALVQMIVRADTPDAVVAGMQRFLDALRARAAQIPDNGVLRRKRVPDKQTEIRYFFPGDSPVAEAVRTLLRSSTGIDATTTLLSDTLVPRKMIQISFAPADLTKAYPTSLP